MSKNIRLSRQTRITLAALSGTGGRWVYGYELMKATGLKSGTIYPILIRLADHGYLEKRWEAAAEPGRPPRHLYCLTPSGQALASAEGDSAGQTGRKEIPV